MDAEPETIPQAWVIFCGLQDTKRPPYVMHKLQDVRGAVASWQRSRQAHWPKSTKKRFFTYAQSHIVSLKFLSDQMRDSEPIEGFMLYGTLSFEPSINMRELQALAAIMCMHFGQDVIELHYAGNARLYYKEQKTTTM